MASAADDGLTTSGTPESVLQRRQVRHRMDQLSATAVMLFAAFATWWVGSVVGVPLVVEHRLWTAQVVVAAVGLPIVVALWVVAVRMRGMVRQQARVVLGQG